MSTVTCPSAPPQRAWRRGCQPAIVQRAVREAAPVPPPHPRSLHPPVTRGVRPTNLQDAVRQLLRVDGVLGAGGGVGHLLARLGKQLGQELHKRSQAGRPVRRELSLQRRRRSQAGRGQWSGPDFKKGAPHVVVCQQGMVPCAQRRLQPRRGVGKAQAPESKRLPGGQRQQGKALRTLFPSALGDVSAAKLFSHCRKTLENSEMAARPVESLANSKACPVGQHGCRLERQNRKACTAVGHVNRVARANVQHSAERHAPPAPVQRRCPSRAAASARSAPSVQ